MRDTPWLAGLYAHAVRGRIATGPNTGKRIRTWGGSGESQEPEPSARRCANVDGSSVHANVSLPAHQRAKLENLCRYACAQLQLVPIDGENFRRGCAGMSTLRRPDAYSCHYRRSLCRSQDSRLSRPALTATPGCSRSPEPTPRHRRIVMAKQATFAEVFLRHVQCFVLVRPSAPRLLFRSRFLFLLLIAVANLRLCTPSRSA